MKGAWKRTPPTQDDDLPSHPYTTSVSFARPFDRIESARSTMTARVHHNMNTTYLFDPHRTRGGSTRDGRVIDTVQVYKIEIQASSRIFRLNLRNG